MTAEELAELVGYKMPGGTFTVRGYEHWLMTDAIGSPALPAGVAHPMYAYYAALGGMGVSLDEFFALAHAKAEDGVLFGECNLELRSALHVDHTYDVAGSIIGAERKIGKRAGVFDVVKFRLEVRSGIEVAAVAINSFVFPRGA